MAGRRQQQILRWRQLREKNLNVLTRSMIGMIVMLIMLDIYKSATMSTTDIRRLPMMPK